MRCTISMTPYLVGNAAKPKLDGWLITLTIGSSKPSIVRNETEKVADTAMRKAITDYVAAGYIVEAKIHDKHGTLIGHATYATKRGQVERTEHKLPTKSPSAAAQERLDRPKPKKEPKKKAPRRWTLAKAKELAARWSERDAAGALEFLDGFKRGEWSDKDCDKAEKQLTRKPAAAKKAPKSPAKKAPAPKKAAGEKLERETAGKKKRKPSAYNVFIGREVKRLHAQGVDNKEAMRRAADAWRAKKG